MAIRLLEKLIHMNNCNLQANKSALANYSCWNMLSINNSAIKLKFRIKPISVLTIVLSLSISQTTVFAQHKDELKTKNPKEIDQKKTKEISVATIGIKKQSPVIAEPKNNTETQINQKEPVKSNSPSLQSKNTDSFTPPTNFDINAVSSDVRQQLDENKKNGRPFFEGISLALEFELMDAKVSEAEIIERIQKNTDAKTPIQLKKKAENSYWIITDTNTSIAYIKEIVSAAGLTVNFISKSYRLK